MRRRQIFSVRQREADQEVMDYAKGQEQKADAGQGREEVLMPVRDVTCPKCGKALPRRGAHFHIRACRG